MIRSAVETVEPAAAAKEIRVQLVLDPLAGPVSGDSNRLQQVFWNLLSNAIKFTLAAPEPRRVDGKPRSPRQRAQSPFFMAPSIA